MELVDIFSGDAFRAVTLTTNINKEPYRPNFLGQLGIFTPVPVRTIDGAVAITDEGTLKVVPTTPRGAPPYEQTIPLQNIRRFTTPRISVADTIRSHELQNILARNIFQAGSGLTIVFQALSDEIAYRLNSPTGLQAKIETTKERMRLGAIQGQVLDADGTVLYDWPTLLGMALPTEIAFNLQAATPAAGVLAEAVRDMKRAMLRAAKAGSLTGVRVIALCGDDFFDAFVRHPDVITSWATFQVTASATAMARLGSPLPNVDAFDTFPWGGIEWINYRGTDDNTTVAIALDKAKFVPIVPGLFQEVLAPGENFMEMNSPGLPIYVEVVPDRDRNRFVTIETRSYPMYVATRPDVLFSGRLGT
jgi:hypothetical protein